MQARRILAVLVLTVCLGTPLVAQSSAAQPGPTLSAGGGPLLPLQPGRSTMSAPQSALLGLVEGLTEFLPVSSTGHLLIVQNLLGLFATPAEKSASDAFAIVIQLGAIIAVFLVSFGRIRKIFAGIFGRDRDGLRLFGNLVVGFIPAALIGLLLEDTVKQYLFGLWPVVGAWVVGGLFILVFLNRRRLKEGSALESLGWQSALIIGFAQVLSLWPGVSRSLATIAGGLLVGLSMSAAVEFSFLLGLVTLGAATIYEGLKRGHEIIHTFGWASPVIGLVVAAVAGFAAVQWMVSYLRTRSLAVFGWYRIAVAILAVVLVAAGVMTA